jgi:threonine dehydratase
VDLVTLSDIRTAQERIAGVAVRTPLLPAGWAGSRGELVYLKPEMLQPVGSFKIRGAYNKIAALDPQIRERGVVGSSSGNHGQALAFAAASFGVKATVVMPATAAPNKVAATRALGAEVILVPPADRDTVPLALAERHGYALVPPYDDPYIIAGQGTIGLEIAADLPDAELALVPVSGGGLISGIATAVKSSLPDARIVGVEPELAADAVESFRIGYRQVWGPERTQRTIADGLRSTSVGELPWEHIKSYVDDVITVTEKQIRETMRAIVVESRLVAEASGAVALAAHLFARDRLPASSHTVAVVSGGNADPSLLADVLTSEPEVPAGRGTSSAGRSQQMT